ncbi:uncharacterized protein G2W53_033994 [Senna tora]|uniref:Uncharacterized protein n=1 Tax=Senna tora TaxID=362788 RepID=A0A834W908_9FABA|nr:uncharacterized protein G2W53_033994 [Senna tora]
MGDAGSPQKAGKYIERNIKMSDS